MTGRRLRLGLFVPAMATAVQGCDARIGEPPALWALWLAPSLVVFYLLAFRSHAARRRRFASAAMIERLTGGASQRRAAAKAALVVVGVTALLLSLARLQMGYTWQEVERRGVDIVVALDVSDSMRVEDAGRSLSRLQRAKRELVDLLRMLEGDRVGVVAFAGTAFVQCPLTLDYGAAELFLDVLDEESIPVQGTDLEQALLTSLETFRGGAAGSRAILLITDGEDHSGKAVEAAERLREEGVRVFAIGIGSPDGAPIPARGGGFRRDRAGDIILSRLDEPTLQELALATGGRYVRSVTGDLDLQHVYADGIKATLEDREIEAQRRQRWEDRFQWLVAAALAVLMLEALIPERARGRGRTRPQPRPAAAGAPTSARRVPARRSGTVTAALALTVALAGAARLGGQSEGGGADERAAPPVASERFDAPEEAYEAGAFDQALEGFLDLQVERPDDPAVTMNVGSAHYRLGDLEAAAHAFESAGAMSGDRVRAQAWYDLGNVAFEQGRVEDAIEHWHRSLDLAPEDEDAKWNLEVARAVLERQQEERQQQRQQQEQQRSDGGEPPPQESERGERPEDEPSDESGERDREKEGSARDGDRSEEGSQGPDQPAGGEEERRDEGETAAAGDAAAEGRLTDAEAARMLDALEEGRPRRHVPAAKRRSQEKDW